MTDPLDLLESFDISMTLCEAFYDGETFHHYHVEDPHLTFNMVSRISPPRAAVIEAYIGLPTYVESSTLTGWTRARTKIIILRTMGGCTHRYSSG
jgi:hypothetical protein